MGDGDNRARVLLQVVLQPGDRFGVEVVGRLVEQEDIRLGEQEAGEGDAPPLAAAEHGDGRIAGRAAQGVHRQLQLIVEVPGVVMVEPVLQPALFGDERVEVGVGVGEALVDGVEGGEVVHDGLHRFLDHLAHRLAVVQLRLLFQQADAVAGGEGDVALVALVLAGDDAQQRALAGAVEAEHADFRAVVEAEADVLENGPVAGREGAADAAHGEDHFFVGHGDCCTLFSCQWLVVRGWQGRV